MFSKSFERLVATVEWFPFHDPVHPGRKEAIGGNTVGRVEKMRQRLKMFTGWETPRPCCCLCIGIVAGQEDSTETFLSTAMASCGRIRKANCGTPEGSD